MKYWNITDLLVNDTTTPPFDYSLSVTLNGANYPIYNDLTFRNTLMFKYTSFLLKSPVYFNTVQNQYINLINDIDEANGLLQYSYMLWKDDRKPAIEKLVEALRGSYNPLWNVDGVTGTIRESTHTGTDTDTHTGTANTALSDTGSITNTGKSKNVKTGNETIGATGHDINTEAKTTFDSNTMRDTVKNDLEHGKTDTHTYNQVTDSYSIDSQSPLVESRNLSGSNNTTYNETMAKNLNLSDKDLEMIIRQGNIGVTSSQSLIEQQLHITDLDKLITYCINDFVHSYLILR